MSSWEERHQDEPSERYFCECADTECHEGVRLDRREYEAVRSDPAHFVLAVGHADLTIERVVLHTALYVVVEKHDDVRPLVEQTDPRQK